MTSRLKRNKDDSSSRNMVTKNFHTDLGVPLSLALCEQTRLNLVHKETDPTDILPLTKNGLRKYIAKKLISDISGVEKTIIFSAFYGKK